MIQSSGKKYNRINFSKNHVSGTARKIGVTFIWWFTNGRLLFAKLIESYQEKGYDPTSFLTVDKECRLIDGNHRMGVNLFMGIEKLNVRYLKRSSGFSRNLDGYFKIGLKTAFIEKVMGEFRNIQKWLVESGNTFSCLLRGEYENDSISLISDLKCMSHVYCEVAHDKSDKLGGVLVQFSLDFPSYSVKNGKLVSKRATEIEKMLELRKKQFGLDVEIKVSKNCLEGKEMWKMVKATAD
ncbi:MAG: hypothetical protein IKH01_03210 [Prevotella sp.]|nr:hypothetical protein [Prevotella sp.]